MFTGGVGRHPQGKLPISKDYMGDPSSKTVRLASLRGPLWINQLKPLQQRAGLNEFSHGMS